MTRSQALTQQLGALLDLRSCIHAGHIHCCAGMAREIEARTEQIRREIRTLTAAEQINPQPERIGLDGAQQIS